MSKLIITLLILAAIAANPSLGQHPGSAAGATVLERFRQAAIRAAMSPDSPALEGPIDNCVRKPMPAPVQRKKYGFSFTPVDSAKKPNYGIYYKDRGASSLLQIFSGQGQDQSVLPTNNNRYGDPTKEKEWPIPKFPGCAVPSCVPSEYAWNSPAIREAKTEILELVLAHKDVMRINSDLVNLGRDYNSSTDNAKACAYVKVDFSDLKIQFFGFGNKFSEVMQCNQHQSANWAFDCVSKSGRAVSSQAIRSDKGSYVLFFQCWDSGEQTWSLFRNADLDYKLTPDSKWDILRTLEPLGFSPCEYEQIDRSQCKQSY